MLPLFGRSKNFACCLESLAAASFGYHMMDLNYEAANKTKRLLMCFVMAMLKEAFRYPRHCNLLLLNVISFLFRLAHSGYKSCCCYLEILLRSHHGITVLCLHQESWESKGLQRHLLKQKVLVCTPAAYCNKREKRNSKCMGHSAACCNWCSARKERRAHALLQPLLPLTHYCRWRYTPVYSA